MFSHKIPWWGTVHKTLCWLGCGFALSGLWTSVELCGKPLESHCPPCRYITHHGVVVWCHSHNRESRVPHRNQRRPNPVQQFLKHEREKEDREECKRLGAIAGIVCVWVCVHVRMRAGTLPVGRGQEASCVFRLPCEHPVHWEKNGDRRSAMLISILSLSSILSHPYTHTHTHKGNYHAPLPRLCQSTSSNSPQTDTLTDGEGLREQLNGCSRDYKERDRNPWTFFPRPGPQFTVCPKYVRSKSEDLHSICLAFWITCQSQYSLNSPLKSFSTCKWLVALIE